MYFLGDPFQQVIYILEGILCQSKPVFQSGTWEYLIMVTRHSDVHTLNQHALVFFACIYSSSCNHILLGLRLFPPLISHCFVWVSCNSPQLVWSLLTFTC